MCFIKWWKKKKKCNEICNVLSPKICVLKETDLVVKTLYMIKNKNEAMAKNISRDCKCKFNSTKFNSNQNWNNETCQCMYLESIANTSLTTCDEIVCVTIFLDSTKLKFFGKK